MDKVEANNQSQYKIGDCTYTVNRVFNNDKSLKEIITDKIVTENLKSQN